MKTNVIVVLIGLVVFSFCANAQNIDPYEDDAYYTQKDELLLRQQAKERAQKLYLQRLAEIQEQRRRDSIEYVAYLNKLHGEEVDAYNGHSDSHIGRNEYSQSPSSDDPSGVYGEYSSRIRRFHDGKTIIINNPSNVNVYSDYCRGDSYGYSGYYDYGWGSSYASSFYPWYDDYYPYYGRWYHRYPRYWGYSAFYDPFYYPYYVGYYGYYSPYWSGYYDYYPGYYYPYSSYSVGYYNGYYSGVYNSRYITNEHRNGNRSYRSYYTSSYSSPYEAVRRVRSANGGYYSDGSYSRTTPLNGNGSYSRRSYQSSGDTYRSNSSSYSRSYQDRSSSSRSYNSGSGNSLSRSSSSSSSRSSGGGSVHSRGVRR